MALEAVVVVELVVVLAVVVVDAFVVVDVDVEFVCGLHPVSKTEEQNRDSVAEVKCAANRSLKVPLSH